MSGFDDREKMEENKYKHDEELNFKVRNRRNKLFGIWLAQEHFGYEGDAVADYGKAVVMADFDEPGDDDVFRKVEADLEAASISIARADLQAKLDSFEGEARAQIMAE